MIECRHCSRTNYAVNQGNPEDMCYRCFWHIQDGYTVDCCVCGEPAPKINAGTKYCSKACRSAVSQLKYQSSIVSCRAYYIHKRDGFRCIYCGASSIEDGVKLHLDHITPKSREGADTVNNLVSACSRCNISKSNNLLPPDILTRVADTVNQRNKSAGFDPSMKITDLKWEEEATYEPSIHSREVDEPKTTLETMCTCGHTFGGHQFFGDNPCLFHGCECGGFHEVA